MINIDGFKRQFDRGKVYQWLLAIMGGQCPLWPAARTGQLYLCPLLEQLASHCVTQNALFRLLRASFKSSLAFWVSWRQSQSLSLTYLIGLVVRSSRGKGRQAQPDTLEGRAGKNGMNESSTCHLAFSEPRIVTFYPCQDSDLGSTWLLESDELC